MKLLSMHIDNFGRLHNYDFTFQEGLNVILEDNGWGKTTMAAFLKAMLYGYGTKRSKDISENERKRYIPWQGGKYGGSLDFEAGGVRYRILRTFGETPRFDTARIIDLDKNTTAKLPADMIGETLFHLDSNAFKRSVFINQNGMMIDGAASSIHTRLNALVSSANDLAVYDGAIKKLTEEIKVYEKTGSRGLIGDIDRKTTQLQTELESAEKDIRNQDSARERIEQIDRQLKSINAELEEKEKRLEIVSGESKKKEAARALLEEIDGRINVLQSKLDELKTELNGKIPSQDEINRALQNSERIARIKARIEKIVEERKLLTEEFEKIASRYGGVIPSSGQIDEISSIYGELQGLLKSGVPTDMPEAENVPEGYTVIKKAFEDDADLIASLENASLMQAKINALRLEMSACENDITHENDSWAEIKRRYKTLVEETSHIEKLLEQERGNSPDIIEPVIKDIEKIRDDIAELKQRSAWTANNIEHETISWNEKRKQYFEQTSEIEETEKKIQSLSRFSRENVSPKLIILRDLQVKQNEIENRKRNIDGRSLTADEERILSEKEGELPSAEQAREIQNRYRGITVCKSDLHSLESRLEGEKSKCESLKTALSQLDAAEGVDTDAENKKTDVVLIGAGFAAVIAGIVLAVVISPAFAVAALIGAALAAYGFSKQKKNKEQARILQEKKSETERKKAELSAELEKSEKEINSISRRIEELEQRIRPDEETITQWCCEWKIDENSLSETYFDELTDCCSQIKELKERKAAIEDEKKLVQADEEYMNSMWLDVIRAFPECSEMTFYDASVFLSDARTDYTALANGQAAKIKKLEKFIGRSGVTKADFLSEDSPKTTAYRNEQEEISSKLDALYLKKQRLDDNVPEIKGLEYENALSLLRSRVSAYNNLLAQRNAARKNEERLLRDTGYTREELDSQLSPRMESLVQKKELTGVELDNCMSNISNVFGKIGIIVNSENLDLSVQSAREMLSEYRQYESILRERKKQKDNHKDACEALQAELAKKLDAINIRSAYSEIPERIEFVRNDINAAAAINGKERELTDECSSLSEEKASVEQLINDFVTSYSRFTSFEDDKIRAVSERADLYGKTAAALEQLNEQRQKHISEYGISDEPKSEPEEILLRESVERLKNNKNDLLIEYTQKSEFIRNADKTLEKYPLLVQETEQAAQSRSKALNKVAVLKRTIMLITKAKENLANRYLNNLERLFNSYMQIWLESDAVRGILDIDFNIKIEENDKLNEAKGYSTGYCDMIDFCMRLALIDTLFENEQPFIILDDPFVNLDAERLEKAMELLGVLALSKQIVYFVCHPIRAFETDANSETRKEFEMLAEKAKRTLRSKSTSEASEKKNDSSSPRDLYKLADTHTRLPIKLEKTNYTITNNIFSLNFVCDESVPVNDRSYELFFVDSKGHVLNDRQLLNISGGQLSSKRVHFCLNTRDDSGDQYELMIREAGKDDYTVEARIPFKAKLTFAGTFDFDF